MLYCLVYPKHSEHIHSSSQYTPANQTTTPNLDNNKAYPISIVANQTTIPNLDNNKAYPISIVANQTTTPNLDNNKAYPIGWVVLCTKPTCLMYENE